MLIGREFTGGKPRVISFAKLGLLSDADSSSIRVALAVRVPEYRVVRDPIIQARREEVARSRGAPPTSRSATRWSRPTTGPYQSTGARDHRARGPRRAARASAIAVSPPYAPFASSAGFAAATASLGVRLRKCPNRPPLAVRAKIRRARRCNLGTGAPPRWTAAGCTKKAYLRTAFSSTARLKRTLSKTLSTERSTSRRSARLLARRCARARFASVPATCAGAKAVPASSTRARRCSTYDFSCSPVPALFGVRSTRASQSSLRPSRERARHTCSSESRCRSFPLRRLRRAPRRLQGGCKCARRRLGSVWS